MKRKFTNKAKALVVAGVIGVLGFSVVAAPVIEEVKAQFKHNLTYTLNGQNVLEGKGGLVYKDQVYVPLRDVANTLGTVVEYKDGQIIMIQEGNPSTADTKQLRATDEVPAVADTVEIAKAKVIEVNLEAKQITILPAGLEDKVENYIVLNVDEEATSIAHEKNRMRYTMNDITPGMEINAVHKSMMTMSIPAQTPAISITVLGDSPAGEVDPNLAVCPIAPIHGSVLDINNETKTITIGEANDPEGQLIVHTDEKTSIIESPNRKASDFKNLKVGQKVIVTVGNTMTASLPPQATAVEIEIVNK